ncbi:MAG: HEPN domain-containing protein [candidate division WS1 bacterium]|jgi:HEPN domain-containing protein|nr:HEPN domain-containing protein [candidate division WS1 bacterium]
MTARPEEVRRELATEWLCKGDKDLAVARFLMTNMHDAAEAIGFHLQQTAKNYLKGYLTLAGQQPPRTHDILELRSVVATVDAILAEGAAPLDALNPFAVLFRYPGPTVIIDVSELQPLLADLDRLRETIAAAICAEADAAADEADGESHD